MIVLDTNVISELLKPAPADQVLAWVDRHPSAEVFVTAVTTAELRYGIARLPAGRRRSQLGERVEGIVTEDLVGRILPFDDAAAVHYAQIVAGREGRGKPISMADAQIAAICRSHGAPLATRNGKDFVNTDVLVVDPWR